MLKKKKENQRESDFLRQIEVLVIQTFLGGRAALKGEMILMGEARISVFLVK